MHLSPVITRYIKLGGVCFVVVGTPEEHRTAIEIDRIGINGVIFTINSQRFISSADNAAGQSHVVACKIRWARCGRVGF